MSNKTQSTLKLAALVLVIALIPLIVVGGWRSVYCLQRAAIASNNEKVSRFALEVETSPGVLKFHRYYAEYAADMKQQYRRAAFMPWAPLPKFE